MDYKLIIIIILSVLLFVIVSVLLYLLFGRGQANAFRPPINNTTLTLLDTFSETNNLGIFDMLYGDISLDEKQVAVADAYNLLDSHASMIKNSPDSDDVRKLDTINHLKSMFDATNTDLRNRQIQSRGLDVPVVSNMAFAASKLTDWIRTVPASKYPSEDATISRQINNEFSLAEDRRMQTQRQREESIAQELEINSKLADEWGRQHPKELQKLREIKAHDDRKKVEAATLKRQKRYRRRRRD